MFPLCYYNSSVVITIVKLILQLTYVKMQRRYKEAIVIQILFNFNAQFDYLHNICLTLNVYKV